MSKEVIDIGRTIGSQYESWGLIGSNRKSQRAMPSDMESKVGRLYFLKQLRRV